MENLPIDFFEIAILLEERRWYEPIYEYNGGIFHLYYNQYTKKLDEWHVI